MASKARGKTENKGNRQAQKQPPQAKKQQGKPKIIVEVSCQNVTVNWHWANLVAAGDIQSISGGLNPTQEATDLKTAIANFFPGIIARAKAAAADPRFWPECELPCVRQYVDIGEPFLGPPTLDLKITPGKTVKTSTSQQIVTQAVYVPITAVCALPGS